MQIFCSQNVSQSSLSQESEQNISIKKQERNPNFVQLKQRKITTISVLYPSEWSIRAPIIGPFRAWKPPHPLCHKEPARSKQNTPQWGYFAFQSP